MGTFLRRSVFTHRRSTAERGGCFERRLFVCQHDNFRTIERTDDETWQLGAMYKNLTRVRTSRSKVKGQGHRGQKNEKHAAFCSGVVLWGVHGPRAAFFSGAVFGGA